MPQPSRNIAIAGLSFALPADGGKAPTELQLTPTGMFNANDGRPFDVPSRMWRINATIAAGVIARAAARQTDLVIDFEHQSLYAKENGKRVEAAGWIPRTLEWREGAGLFATNVSWVGDTADLIDQKKVRYISPLFLYDADTGDVLEMISVALTNTPALDNLPALAALARAHSYFSTGKEAEMEQVAALTAERDALNTSVAALTTERDSLKGNVVALTAERDQLKAEVAKNKADQEAAAQAAEKKEHGALVTAALSDGRLTPALKPWAEKQSLAVLTEFLGAAAPMPIAGDPQHRPASSGGHGLTEDQLAICSRMGVTPEAFLEAQKQN